MAVAQRQFDFDLDVVVRSAESVGILLAFALRNTTGIDHVLHRHPSIASPHSTIETDQTSRPAVSRTPQP